MTAAVRVAVPVLAGAESVIASVAPSIDGWLRHAIAVTLANPQASPGALYSIADALEELAAQVLLATRPASAGTLPLVRQVEELRAIVRVVSRHAAGRAG